MCHTPQTRYRLVTLWSSWCVTRDFNIKYMLVVPAANRWFENTIYMLANEWSFLFWVEKFRILLQQDLSTQTSNRSQKGTMVVCYFGIVFNRSSPLCEAKRHHKSTIFNRNFIQEKTDRFSNCWFGSLGFCCNKIWTHKPQTDHKVQVKGIMVVCYFGVVFNRSSQLDHWSLCGSPPLWSQKASQINNFQ